MGKGDWRRPAAVPEAELASVWCERTGSHHIQGEGSYAWCTTCGMSLEQIKCEHKRKVTPEGRYTHWRCLDCGAEGRVERPTGGSDA